MTQIRKDQRILKRLIIELKSKCNRYVNGQCTTLSCLYRGGQRLEDKKLDHDKATCERHEQVKVLETLISNRP